jgi:hypothetical protein
MIVDRIVSELTRTCITEIPHKDPTRLTIVKSGRFQVDPGITELRVSVQGGDLENPDLMDTIVDINNNPSRVGFHVDAREIGGTAMWYRRGTARIELFFITDQLEEMVSRDRAYTILGRVQDTIPATYVADLYDGYGEHAVKLFHTQNSLVQSGGPPSSYLWRGKVVWECLTEREY